MDDVLKPDWFVQYSRFIESKHELRQIAKWVRAGEILNRSQIVCGRICRRRCPSQISTQLSPFSSRGGNSHLETAREEARFHDPARSTWRAHGVLR